MSISCGLWIEEHGSNSSFSLLLPLELAWMDSSSSASHITKDTNPAHHLRAWVVSSQPQNKNNASQACNCEGETNKNKATACLSIVSVVASIIRERSIDRPTYAATAHDGLEKGRRGACVVGRECIQRNGPPVSDMG